MAKVSSQYLFMAPPPGCNGCAAPQETLSVGGQSEKRGEATTPKGVQEQRARALTKRKRKDQSLRLAYSYTGELPNYATLFGGDDAGYLELCLRGGGSNLF